MSEFVEDRPPLPAGGLVVPGPDSVVADPADREALLVLSDGSVWRGLRVGAGGAAVGEVSWCAGFAAVGESTLLNPRDSVLLERHLRAAVSAGSRLHGCITAVGATTPLHAAVALAIARGEIGRP